MSPPSTIGDIPLKQLANHANSYAAAHGLQVEKRIQIDDSSSNSSSGEKKEASTYQCAPISLLPNAFPATEFERAKSLASNFNELVDRISRDGDFLQSTLGGPGGVTDADPYTRKLLQLYNEIYCGKGVNGEEWGKFAREADCLGVQRSDYMLNSKKDEQDKIYYELKQVELNTIASSFAGLSVNVAGLHRHLTQRFKNEVADFIESNERAVMGQDYVRSDGEDKGVPINPALTCIPRAMNVAYDQYQNRFEKSNSDRVILFVVQEGETNTVDQRFLEFNLWERHSIPVVRMSLTAAHTRLELDESTGTLYIKSNDGNEDKRQEVSVVYFRAGYSPADYPDGDDGIEWLSREKIERSRATKCPCLGYHLAGTKKVQQELARPGTLERFFGEGREADVESLRGAFAGLYSLGSDATPGDIDALRDALSGGEGRYVLKPQREGGGYNFYGDNLVKKVRENVMEDPSTKELKLGSELAEFILMERLFPPQQKSILLRAGLIEGIGETISELGCFGTIVSTNDGNVLHNEYAGFLLRTKFSGVDEGGVASGFATLSSPSLC
uniref:Glutathione synthetase n=1 Tax=Ditylum brightwellii TaxID=49249 RepID=A0A7S4TA49_9STRA